MNHGGIITSVGVPITFISPRLIFYPMLLAWQLCCLGLRGHVTFEWLGRFKPKFACESTTNDFDGLSWSLWIMLFWQLIESPQRLAWFEPYIAWEEIDQSSETIICLGYLWCDQEPRHRFPWCHHGYKITPPTATTPRFPIEAPSKNKTCFYCFLSHWMNSWAKSLTF